MDDAEKLQEARRVVEEAVQQRAQDIAENNVAVVRDHVDRIYLDLSGQIDTLRRHMNSIIGKVNAQGDDIRMLAEALDKAKDALANVVDYTAASITRRRVPRWKRAYAWARRKLRDLKRSLLSVWRSRRRRQDDSP